MQDLGDVTELLSGEFYEPLGRSSSHQLWSSAMVVTPAVRGMFGLEADALLRVLHVAPQLPAGWDGAEVKNMVVGKDRFDVTMKRVGGAMEVEAVSAAPTMLCLEAQRTFAAAEMGCNERRSETHHRLSVPLPAVEVGLVKEVLEPGQRTREMKVLSQVVNGREMRLRVEAPGGTERRLAVRRNGPAAAKGVQVEGARMEGDQVVIPFPAGEGYQAKDVVLRW